MTLRLKRIADKGNEMFNTFDMNIFKLRLWCTKRIDNKVCQQKQYFINIVLTEHLKGRFIAEALQTPLAELTYSSID